MPPDGSWMDQLPDVRLPGQASPAAPPSTGLHAAPDGSGAMTSLSDEDYAKIMGASRGAVPSGGLPQVNLPEINVGGDPTKTAAGGRLLALPAPGSPPEAVGQRSVIDVGGAVPGKPETKPDTSWMNALPSVKLPHDAPDGAPQMTGLARAAALPASAIASGVISAAATPGDIMRGITMLGGAKAAGDLQGTPFSTPEPPGPLQPISPQMLASAPGKQEIPAPTGHNPLDSGMLMGLTNAAGITNRPDLKPTGLLERGVAAAGSGIGMMAPAVLSGGASTIPAALRLARAGAGLGIGSEIGGEVGQAVGGTPGHVIGAVSGGVLGAAPGGVAGLIGAATGLNKPARELGSVIQGALPLPKSWQADIAARSFAPANTPENRAALEAPSEIVPGSPATSYQVTGDPFLGAHERGIANRVGYKPEFDAVRQQQNAARVAAIEGAVPKDADVGGIVPWFQGRLRQMRDAEAGEIGTQREATQAAVDAMGNPIAPHQAGEVVRGEVEAKRAPAVEASDRVLAAVQGRAERATVGIGGEPAPNAEQTHGARMRGVEPENGEPGTGLEGERIPVRNAASKLYDAVDPDGTLALNVAPVRDTARDLLKEVNPRMGGKLDPAESGPLDAAAKMRGVELFSDLRALRSNVGTALREIAQGGGSTSAAYRRMTLLMDAIDGAMARGAGEAAVRNPAVAADLVDLARGDASNVVDRNARTVLNEGVPPGVHQENEVIPDQEISGSPTSDQTGSEISSGGQRTPDGKAIETPEISLHEGNPLPYISEPAIDEQTLLGKLQAEAKAHVAAKRSVARTNSVQGGKNVGTRPTDNSSIRTAKFPGASGTEISESGRPGSDAGNTGIPGEKPQELTPNFTPEARDALKTANAAWADYKARFGKGAVGDVLASSSRTLSGYRVPDSGVPSKLFAKGNPGAEAADSLIAATGSPDAALGVLGEYPAFSLRQAAEKMGRLSVPDYEKWMRDHASVMDKFPQLKASFDTAAKASAVLDDLKTQRRALDATNPIKAAETNAGVIGQFVRPGPKGYEGAQALVENTGSSPAAMDATRDHLATMLRERAMVKTGPNAGTLDDGAYQGFMKDYNSFLSHPSMVDTRASFADAGKAQEALDIAAAAHQEAQKAYQASVARHFLGPDSDPVKSMASILSRRDPGPELADLSRQVAADPEAAQAIQSAAIKAILERVESNNPVGRDLNETYLKANETQNLIGNLVGDNLDGPLRHIMTPEQMKALADVRMDTRRGNLSISGNKTPGGSDTGLITSSRESDSHSPAVATSLGMMEIGGEIGEHFMNSKVGKIIGVFAIPALNAMRHAGFQTVNDLRAAALLDPKKMSALLARLPTEAEIPSRLAAIRAQLAASVTAGTRAGNEPQKKAAP